MDSFQKTNQQLHVKRNKNKGPATITNKSIHNKREEAVKKKIFFKCLSVPILIIILLIRKINHLLPSSDSSIRKELPFFPMADLKISFAETFLCSAFAACFAEFFTIPLDTAKVRLQLQKAAGDGHSVPKYRGLWSTMATIAQEEGVSALWKGIIAGLHRQCIYGGLRIGLYEPVKTLLVGSQYVGDIPLYQKILAALLTGALAIAVANPTDLVKVRLQAEGKTAVGAPKRYYGTLDAYCTIARQEGLGALWTGLGPNIARNAIVNAAELASYDQVKETIMKIPGFSDNILTHLLAGLGAGFFAVCIGSPIDVVKSRMMGDTAFKNTLDCFVKTMKNEGPSAFYKGFLPNFVRLGTWNVIMFLTLEQAKRFFLREVIYD